MRITPTQAKVLSSVCLQADRTIPDIAKECKLRPHVARYALHDLARHAHVRAFPIVNIHALGYTDYCVFLTLTSENQASRQKVLKFFAESPRTAWVAELSGEFHYTVSIFARDVFEVESYFRALAKIAPGVVVEKSLAIRISWTTFRCKYLSNHPSTLDYITRSRSETIERLDTIDHVVLRAISEHPLAPMSHQARAAGMAGTTFHHRVKALQNRGILFGTVYFMDMARMGIHTFRLLIQAKTSTDKLTRLLWDFAHKHPNIVGFVHCFGAWDYELNVETLDPAALANIHDSIEDLAGSQIRSIRAVSVLGTPKTKAYPFAHDGVAGV
jgi:DNA-binding Lrp family transcriptional regulator